MCSESPPFLGKSCVDTLFNPAGSFTGTVVPNKSGNVSLVDSTHALTFSSFEMSSTSNNFNATSTFSILIPLLDSIFFLLKVVTSFKSLAFSSF